MGRSSFTDALKLTPVTLKNGAYRIVSGEGCLALLGDGRGQRYRRSGAASLRDGAEKGQRRIGLREAHGVTPP